MFDLENSQCNSDVRGELLRVSSSLVNVYQELFYAR